jgi:hypothetical protein
MHIGRTILARQATIRLRELAIRLGKTHLPTGYITLAELLRVAITDLGVEPLHDDWADVLDRCDRVMRAALPER